MAQNVDFEMKFRSWIQIFLICSYPLGPGRPVSSDSSPISIEVAWASLKSILIVHQEHCSMPSDNLSLAFLRSDESPYEGQKFESMGWIITDSNKKINEYSINWRPTEDLSQSHSRVGHKKSRKDRNDFSSENKMNKMYHKNIV